MSCKAKINSAVAHAGSFGQPTFFVLDDPNTGMRSTQAVLKANKNASVHAVSDNADILRLRGKFSTGPDGRVEISHGLSTDVLKKLVRKKAQFQTMFLDYCCTAKRGIHKFDWVEDVSLCVNGGLLAPTGVLFVTFARRNAGTNQAHCVEQALRHHGPFAQKTGVWEYHDSSAMQVYTLVHKNVWGADPPRVTDAIEPRPGDLVEIVDRSEQPWLATVETRWNDAEWSVAWHKGEVDECTYTVAKHEMRMLPFRFPADWGGVRGQPIGPSPTFEVGARVTVHGEGPNAFHRPWPAIVCASPATKAIGPAFVVLALCDRNEYDVCAHEMVRAPAKLGDGVTVVDDPHRPDPRGAWRGHVVAGPFFFVKSTEDNRVYRVTPKELVRTPHRAKKKRRK